MVSFKKGDKVAWQAGGRGGSHSVEGTIVAVVAPGALPKLAVSGATRPHKSFIVEDENKRLYWPRVASLVKVG